MVSKKRPRSTSSINPTIVNNFVPPSPTGSDAHENVEMRNMSTGASSSGTTNNSLQEGVRLDPYRLSVSTSAASKKRNSLHSPTLDHLSLSSPTNSSEYQYWTMASRPKRKSMGRTPSEASILASSDEDNSDDSGSSHRQRLKDIISERMDFTQNPNSNSGKSIGAGKKGSRRSSTNSNSFKYRIPSLNEIDNYDTSHPHHTISVTTDSARQPKLTTSNSTTSLTKVAHIIKKNPSADPKLLAKEFDVQHLPPSKSILAHFKDDYLTIRDFIWNTFEQDVPTLLGKVVNVVLVSLIIFSVVLFVVSTEPSFQHEAFEWTLFALEYVISIIFIIEYLLRLFSCPSSSSYSRGPILGRLRFIISLGSIVDLIAVLPSMVTLNWILVACMAGECLGKRPNDVLPFRSTFTVVLRFFRFARLGKLERHFKAVALVKTIIVNKFSEILLATFVILFTTTLVATLMWITEGDAQPEKFGSIVRSYYYVFILLSTIGLGDVVPVTVMGKITSVAAAVIAISIFSLPTAIISSTLMEQLELKRERKRQIEQKVREFKRIANKATLKPGRKTGMLRAMVEKHTSIRKDGTSVNDAPDQKEVQKRNSRSLDKPRISIDTLTPNELKKQDQSDTTSVISSPNSEASQKSILTSSDDESRPAPRRRSRSMLSNTSGGALRRSESRVSLARSFSGFSKNPQPPGATPHGGSQMGAGAGGAAVLCCPNCQHKLSFNFGFSSENGSAADQRRSIPMAFSSQNLTADSSSQYQDEQESAEEIWALFKKNRGAVEIKEFCRVMNLKGFSFTRKEVLDMLESVDHRSSRITFNAFKAMMGYDDGMDEMGAGPAVAPGFGTFGL
mmetsp:Transcript_6085/g.23041  ORF Transcript_6085/g.23041 Transcript_6085/m.23041 type:complete len:845 (-) Transcript_6085:192-2726(-)|eukprot:CAMPEP_0117439106 /NCGR_PEP_ID=MMETSP0759-20121206/2397_1 /TAXON_ID=63605 /ORGANISM="Percolomonas cosmopolitus, Strain WS" /LENGTH=844 /DNA_ID=CAMNT_0005230817 /DNA_START=681 /DNA_END=3215 /DNA_ORIENTATION=+